MKTIKPIFGSLTGKLSLPMKFRAYRSCEATEGSPGKFGNDSTKLLKVRKESEREDLVNYLLSDGCYNSEFLYVL